MATRFGRVLQADVDVTLSQDRMQEVTDFIEKSLIVDGVLLKDIALKTGQTNEVPHPLNRPPNGCIVVNKVGSSFISTSSDVNKNPKTTLLLNTTANVTVSLWVF